MDDLVLFGNSKDDLRQWQGTIEGFLHDRLLLSLKPSATLLHRTLHGLNFLGMRIYPGFIRVKLENRKRSIRRAQRTLEAWQNGDIDEGAAAQSMASVIGHLRYFCSNDRMNLITEGFQMVQVQIDHLGSRWGIRNESVFRRTMKEVLEKSFGIKVEERHIAGEQFDCIISDGQHILVEIAASAGKDILERLQKKRQLYKEHSGITPSRFILAVGSIYSRRAEELRANGFEVGEPEE